MLQEAAKVREEGRKSMEVAQRMQVEITQEANELEARVLLLQEKERQVADVSLLLLKPVSNTPLSRLQFTKTRGGFSRSAGE